MKKVLAILATTTLLAACGDNTTDRAVSGGAIGAGAGALIGSTMGHGGAGALIGGAAGAAVGGMTDSNDVNLGKPIWR